MHIAVSLNGEGSGHATRMTALCGPLSERHRVTIWCPRHTRLTMQPRLPRCTFHAMPYTPTLYDGNKVRNWATVRANAGLFWRGGRLVRALARKLEALGADAVVADYEPFLPRAARLAGIPSILFNHQGVVDLFPKFQPSWFIAWTVNRIMMPVATGRILSSFYDGDIGALLRPEIAGRREPPEDFILVYARRGFDEHILPVLDKFPGTRFRVFPSREHDFAQSLAACRGMIAPAGHQLTSEALHLRKPLLAFPQSGQYEQEINARMLERTGWGIHGRLKHTERDVSRFLELLPRFPLREPDPRFNFRFDDSTGEAVRLLEQKLEQAIAGR